MSKRAAMMGAVSQQTTGAGGAVLYSAEHIATEIWLDGMDATTFSLSTDTITQWRDKSGNARHMNPTGTALLYAVAAGHDATNKAVNMNIGTLLGSAASLTSSQIVAVMGYGDGTTGVFNNYERVFDHGAQYLAGHGATSNWFAGPVSGAYVNGSDALTTTGALPMPKSVQRIAYTETTGTFYPLNRAANSRGISGPIYEYIVLSTSVTPTEVEKLVGSLAWKWGIQGNLSGDNVWTGSAPTV